MSFCYYNSAVLGPSCIMCSILHAILIWSKPLRFKTIRSIYHCISTDESRAACSGATTLSAQSIKLSAFVCRRSLFIFLKSHYIVIRILWYVNPVATGVANAEQHYEEVFLHLSYLRIQNQNKQENQNYICMTDTYYESYSEISLKRTQLGP